MKKFIIRGPTKSINGTVSIEGAKNSALPIMASSILFKDKIIIKNIPFVKDVLTMKKLLESLGSTVQLYESKRTIIIKNPKEHKKIVSHNLVSTMRAGVLTMGPLLGRYQNKEIKTALGGGCSLGVRATNFHTDGFKSLGAQHFLKEGYVNLKSPIGLKGSTYKFPKITVTGTENLIMAAIFVNGSHNLHNISVEPEVIDLIKFLNNSGAKIKFIGRRSIKIRGIKNLITGSHKIIPDRIETFSYLAVAAITKGKINVKNTDPSLLKSELNVLSKIGCKMKLYKDSIILQGPKNIKSINIKTGPYPNYLATDCMPIILAVLTKSIGISRINETIFTNRFMSAPELIRMGAKIKIRKNVATIVGVKSLSGTKCISSDLRTTFAIILGAIAAEGTGTVMRVYHGLRGYYKLDKKLKKLGINIRVAN